MLKRDSLQDALFATILAQFPNRTAAVDALSQLLDVGKAPVYRRLNGQTLLTPREITLLAQTYSISLDDLMGTGRHRLTFTFNRTQKAPAHTDPLENWLAPIQGELELAVKLPEVKVWYVTSEIPVFMHMMEPDLFAFKLYAWSGTAWQMDHLEKLPFHFDMFPPSLLERAKNMAALYQQIPGVEIWTINALDNSLYQIEYKLRCGAFRNPADALRICDCIANVVDKLEHMSRTGEKELIPGKPKAPFELYCNEMLYAHSTILLHSSIIEKVFLVYGNPNNLTTTDPAFCSYTGKWFEYLMRNSAQISGPSEVNRGYFFSRLRQKLEASRQRINSQLYQIRHT